MIMNHINIHKHSVIRISLHIHRHRCIHTHILTHMHIHTHTYAYTNTCKDTEMYTCMIVHRRESKFKLLFNKNISCKQFRVQIGNSSSENHTMFYQHHKSGFKMIYSLLKCPPFDSWAWENIKTKQTQKQSRNS